jgi:Flp pilus assembly protein TadG
MAAKRRSAWDRGQSLLEFALMAPFLLLLLTGVVEIGRVIFYTVEVTNAATAGVQYGAQNALTAKNIAKMQTSAAQDAGVPSMTATAVNGCTCDPGNGTSCTYPVSGQGSCTNEFSCPAGEQIVECVQVNTQANIEPLFHFPGLPASYQANGKAVMRVRR